MWQEIDGTGHTCHWWQNIADSSISAMDIAPLIWLIAGLALAVYTLHLVRVVRDDDRGHAFTHRPSPQSHLTDSTAWPPRAA